MEVPLKTRKGVLPPRSTAQILPHHLHQLPHLSRTQYPPQTLQDRLVEEEAEEGCGRESEAVPDTAPLELPNQRRHGGSVAI
ncbi:hypothetical protein A9Z42_0088480 [Trichoderma parareesei]|uniref:Uncharacterized protein n=1 Tax=Trichoderma parareesei TaxID=858221 RepID=A0A2H3A1H0_TRIPA|nr:hypothetical protein A9Z42_0088480 [Trichoderma parareesei]